MDNLLALFSPSLIIGTLVGLPLMLVIIIVFQRIRLERVENDLLRWNGKPFPFKKKDSILTPVEQTFYKTLQEVTKNAYLIFSQVHISSLMYADETSKTPWELNKKINQFSVDYVLADKQSFKTLLVIELNDKTHLLSGRKQRDAFIKETLDKAGIPLLQWRITEAHQKSSLRFAINRSLNKEDEIEKVFNETSSEQAI